MQLFLVAGSPALPIPAPDDFFSPVDFNGPSKQTRECLSMNFPATKAFNEE